MKIAYFDCFSGISGDMALGALIDCGADRAQLDAVVEALRLGDEVRLEVRREARGHLGDLPDGVKAQALDAINRLARVESDIHGVPEDEVHLHELGGADTLVDVVGAFWLLHALEVGRVYASALPAPHGLKDGMPLPAPASLRVLAGTGAVLQPVDSNRELVTP